MRGRELREVEREREKKGARDRYRDRERGGWVTDPMLERCLLRIMQPERCKPLP